MRKFGGWGLLTKVIVGIGILSILVFVSIDNNELILLEEQEQRSDDSLVAVPLGAAAAEITTWNSTGSVPMKGLPRKTDHHHIHAASTMSSVQLKGCVRSPSPTT
jgi:hypothetical protein